MKEFIIELDDKEYRIVIRVDMETGDMFPRTEKYGNDGQWFVPIFNDAHMSKMSINDIRRFSEILKKIDKLMVLA